MDDLMAANTLRVEVALPYEAAIEAARAALLARGFGIISEIDLAATLRAKLGVDVPPQLILGACRAPLAYQAIQADPSIATVLPCNVVVRSAGGGTTVIEALDPAAMSRLADDRTLDMVATDARQRLAAALATLGRQA